MKCKKDGQRGAIVIEATISLTAFIFMILTILSIVNTCFIQARISIALNAAAKDLAQYSYLYFASGADEISQKLYRDTSDSKELVKGTIDGVDAFIGALSDGKSTIESGQVDEFDNVVTSVSGASKNLEGIVKQYGEQLQDDPKGFILGMGKMVLNEVQEEAKSFLGRVVAKCFIQKNLKAYPDDDADAFLKRHHVRNGLDGLDFDGTVFLNNADPELIQLVVTYDIEVVRFLDIDYSFRIKQCSKTRAWGHGVGEIEEEKEVVGPGLWSEENSSKKIIAEERKKHEYTSEKGGFDAYDADSNTFITIFTIDTSFATYAEGNGSDEIAKRLKTQYDALNNQMIPWYGDENVQTEFKMRKNGEEVSVYSDPSTRKCKLILIVPADSDEDMVEQGVKSFRESYERLHGVELSRDAVEYNLAYGSGMKSVQEGADDEKESVE